MIGLVAVVFSLLSVSVLAKDKKPMADEFTGVFINMDTPGAMGSQVSIWVESYTADDVAQQLKGILADKGQQALHNAITDYRAGTMRIGTANSYPISVARQRVNADGSRIVFLASIRPFSGFAPTAGSQTDQYPFGVIELKLDAQGKGEGTIIGAAQLSFDAEKNNLSVASYATQPARISDVKTKPKKQ